MHTSEATDPTPTLPLSHLHWVKPLESWDPNEGNNSCLFHLTTSVRIVAEVWADDEKSRGWYVLVVEERGDREAIIGAGIEPSLRDALIEIDSCLAGIGLLTDLLLGTVEEGTCTK